MPMPARSSPTRRLVSAVATLLDPRQTQIRYYAIEALRRIDSDEAASALWPHLDEEADLSRKLELIAFLGRHGFRDGYSQAIEHLSQINLRDQAVEALGADRRSPGRPRAQANLADQQRPGLERRGDPGAGTAGPGATSRPSCSSWRACRAIRSLRRHWSASATSGSPEALPIVQEAIGSRSEALVIAATEAAARLLARPELKSEPIRDRLAALLADADASPPCRTAALEALDRAQRPPPRADLSAVARDANLEGTPLLIEVERAGQRSTRRPRKRIE